MKFGHNFARLIFNTLFTECSGTPTSAHDRPDNTFPTAFEELASIHEVCSPPPMIINDSSELLHPPPLYNGVSPRIVSLRLNC
jgi:hypothetical protein